MRLMTLWVLAPVHVHCGRTVRLPRLALILFVTSAALVSPQMPLRKVRARQCRKVAHAPIVLSAARGTVPRRDRRHASLLFLLSSPRPVRIPVPSQLQDAVISNLRTLVTQTNTSPTDISCPSPRIRARGAAHLTIRGVRRGTTSSGPLLDGLNTQSILFVSPSLPLSASALSPSPQIRRPISTRAS